MNWSDPDPAIRHFERDGIIACGVMAAVALAIRRGQPDVAAGIVAGGLLMAVSYGAIKGGVNLVVEMAARQGAEAPGEGESQAAPAPVMSAGRRIAVALKFFTRYALLAVGAYVMLTCFRLHPAGLLVGAMSPFVAAVAQVVRASRASAHRDHP